MHIYPLYIFGTDICVFLPLKNTDKLIETPSSAPSKYMYKSF